MPTATYAERRGQLETYFDRTAVEAWSRLTSDAPVGRIRGTGALAVEAARRGANVVAIDLSPTLVSLAGERLPHHLGDGSIDFRVGDMLDPGLGEFDHVVGMDSLVHYDARDIVRVVAGLANRTRHSMVFTFAPKTTLLALMHAVGRVLPRGHRAPAIEPVREETLRQLLEREPGLEAWYADRTARVACGFYTSQALEIARG